MNPPPVAPPVAMPSHHHRGVPFAHPATAGPRQRKRNRVNRIMRTLRERTDQLKGPIILRLRAAVTANGERWLRDFDDAAASAFLVRASARARAAANDRRAAADGVANRRARAEVEQARNRAMLEISPVDVRFLERQIEDDFAIFTDPVATVANAEGALCMKYGVCNAPKGHTGPHRNVYTRAGEVFPARGAGIVPAFAAHARDRQRRQELERTRVNLLRQTRRLVEKIRRLQEPSTPPPPPPEYPTVEEAMRRGHIGYRPTSKASLDRAAHRRQYPSRFDRRRREAALASAENAAADAFLEQSLRTAVQRARR